MLVAGRRRRHADVRAAHSSGQGRWRWWSATKAPASGRHSPRSRGRPASPFRSGAGAESLNVAVAAGILLYEVLRDAELPVVIVCGLLGADGRQLPQRLHLSLAERSLGGAPALPLPRLRQAIAWYDNIPMVSWLVLRGRCRGCGARSPSSTRWSSWSPRSSGPAMAASIGASSWQALRGAVFFTILLGIALTDARSTSSPTNSPGRSGARVSCSASSPDCPTVASVAARRGQSDSPCSGWSARPGTRIFKEEAMGGGDIKMMAMVGAFLGWQGVLLTIFLGALLGTPRSSSRCRSDRQEAAGALRRLPRSGRRGDLPVRASPSSRWYRDYLIAAVMRAAGCLAPRRRWRRLPRAATGRPERRERSPGWWTA